jgi:glutathione S-transferase
VKLVIANKTYSSWSLRGWLALKATGAPFEEILVRLDEPTTSDDIARYSPAGRVPVLIDGDVTVWDSLAIAEYLAERFPDAGLWPRDAAARAHARSIAAEMHSGFQHLRNAYPMNLRREGKPLATPAPEADGDIARVAEIWRDARAAHGAGGPFLFGAFTAADAFYAPVAARFRNYGIPRGPVETAYVEAIFAHPAMVEWCRAAALEPWIVPHDEVD